MDTEVDQQSIKNLRGCTNMASNSRTITVFTYLKCEECGNVVTIHRKRSKVREKNHIKHMYCYKCKETQAHIETKDDAFLPDWLRNAE